MLNRALFLFLLLGFHPLSAQHNHNADTAVFDGEYHMLHHWQFRKWGDKEFWGHTEIPGNLHLDLMRVDSIPDPFKGTTEAEVQWVGESDWEYVHHFRMEDALPEGKHAELVFEGLDTYAEILVNGAVVQRCNNMFRRWVIPLGDWLRVGDNEIRVVFRATSGKERYWKRVLGIELPGGDRVYTRKAQYHYGWDWGPELKTAGFWKNAYIRTWEDVRIIDVNYIIKDAYENYADVLAHVRLEADTAAIYDLSFGGDLPELNFKVNTLVGETEYYLPIRIPRPKLWWCRGMGEPNLYRAVMTLEREGESFEMDSRSLGIRRIELVQEADTVDGVAGESFYFRLNGRRVFMRGANYIPQSSFTYGYVPDYIRLFRDVERSNINMLRVWGGGIYEHDVFYDYCNREGILVWQDFMFACGMYPGDGVFMANVWEEAREQIIRLRKNPCIALYCGNNEVSEGWARWGWKSSYGAVAQKRMETWYDRIFKDALPELVNELHPDINYIESSPRFGRGNERYLFEGDAHDWWVWHDAYPFEHLETAVPRFMSEFGFQSYPDPRTMAGYLTETPGRWDPTIPAIASHQKHPRGDSLILAYMKREYNVPERFEDYIWTSQLLQAYGMKRGIEAHRRQMDRCGGTLYWQLNDVWPATSWSGVDGEGRWKAMQHFVRDSYQDVIVSPWIDDKTVKISVVSELPDDAPYILAIRVLKMDGEEVFAKNMLVDTRSQSSEEVWSMEVSELVKGKATKKHFLHASLRRDGDIVHENFLYFSPPSELELLEPGLTWTVEYADKNRLAIRLRSEALAKNVHLIGPVDGWFSDDFFDMIPGQEKLVYFDQNLLPGDYEPKLDPVSFMAGLRVWTLQGSE